MISANEKKLREISYSQKKETKINNSLNQNKISIQSKNITNFAATSFDTVKSEFTDGEGTKFYMILTGRLFKDNGVILSIFILFMCSCYWNTTLQRIY